MPYNLTTMQSIYHGQDEIVEITYLNSIVYQKNTVDYSIPFWVENPTSSSQTVSFDLNDKAPMISYVEASTDGITWTQVDSGIRPQGQRDNFSVTIPGNSRKYFRALTDSWQGGNCVYVHANLHVGGNIMSLFYGSNFTSQTEFPNQNVNQRCNQMFTQNGQGTDFSELLLPAMLLNYRDYNEMFSGGMVAGPKVLPARIVPKEAYRLMFAGYRYSPNLVTAPRIDALFANNYDFKGNNNMYPMEKMFYKCSSLASAPDLHIRYAERETYNAMYDSCTSMISGGKVEAEALGHYSCANMFNNCQSMIQGPQFTLPLAPNNSACFDGTFNGCSSITSLTCLATNNTTVKEPCFGDWFNGSQPANGTFTKATGAIWNTGNAGIPTGWSVVETSPAPEPAIAHGQYYISGSGDFDLVSNINSTDVSYSYCGQAGAHDDYCQVGITTDGDESKWLRWMANDYGIYYEYGSTMVNMKSEYIKKDYYYNNVCFVDVKPWCVETFDSRKRPLLGAVVQSSQQTIVGTLQAKGIGGNAKLFSVKCTVNGTKVLDATVDANGLYDTVSSSYITLPSGWTVNQLS